jgi:hypothetical protein
MGLDKTVRAMLEVVIGQCDREIEKVKKLKDSLEEDVRADIEMILSENKVADLEIREELMNKYLRKMTREKENGYDNALTTLELVKAAYTSLL